MSFLHRGKTITMLLVLLFFSIAKAQQQESWKIDEAEITIATVEKRIREAKQLSSSTSEKAERKKKLLDNYEKALEQLKIAEEKSRELKKFSDFIASIPEQLKTIKEKSVETQADQQQKLLLEKSTLNQLEQTLEKVKAEIELATADAGQLRLEEKRRNERKEKLLKLIAELRQQHEEILSALNVKPATDEIQEFFVSHYIMLWSSGKAISQEIQSYEKEIESYDNRKELLEARIDFADKRVLYLKNKANLWQDAADKQRRLEAEKLAQQARDQLTTAADLHPLIRRLAEENATIASLRTGSEGIAAQREIVLKQEQEITLKLDKLTNDFHSVQEKVKTVGMSKAIGYLLRKKKNELPNISLHKKNINKREEELPLVQLKIIEWGEMRKDLDNVEQKTEKLLNEFSNQIDPGKLPVISYEIKEKLQNKRQSLDLLLNDYDIYMERLIRLDVKEKQFVEKAEEYKNFIEERILWVRSTTVFNFSDLKKTMNAAIWMVNYRHWAKAIKVLFLDIPANPWWWISAMLIFSYLSYLRWIAAAKLNLIANLVSKAQSDQIGHTFTAVYLTMAIAARIPFLIWFLGWRLGETGQSTEFTRAFGTGLRATAEIYLTLSIISSITYTKGLGESHFRWKQIVTEMLHKILNWFLPTTFLLMLLVYTMQFQNNDLWNDSLGRLSFIVMMILLTICLSRIFHPEGLMMPTILANRKMLKKLRKIWYPVLVLLPVILLVIASIGYYYTAFQLQQKLWETLFLCFLVLVVYSLLLRWLLFIRRSIWFSKMIKASEKNSRPIASKPEIKSQEPEVTSQEPVAPVENSAKTEPDTQKREKDDNITIAIIQARRFLRTIAFLSLFFGVWLIWSDVLPALKVIKRITLWSPQVTLSDLLWSIVIAALTIIMSRNLPVFLDIAILKRLNIEKSICFAITTMTTYTTLIIGVLFAFQSINIGWAKVQWLAAALTFGLAFGLQEIFANFISGLIILFERPMRVGDTVTIGDTSGTVSKIRIRATTITDFDRKELIVPNKEFITGRLVNWTLSDTVLRIIVPVGIAYGSDTDLTHQVLMKIAEENDNVLKDPKPRTLFMGFGDSSLNFELRVFIPRIGVYLDTLNELRMTINREFKKNAIEIAFPQRDLHIRSIKAALPVGQSAAKDNHEEE